MHVNFNLGVCIQKAGGDGGGGRPEQRDFHVARLLCTLGILAPVLFCLTRNALYSSFEKQPFWQHF